MTKGTTLHRISERFFNKCGDDFLNKKDLSGFSKDAANICGEEFENTTETYALDGERIRKKQLEHLEELTLRVLAYYQKTEASGFEGAEVPLGDPSVPIDTPVGKIFLKGTADLILRSRHGRIVHDLKSGTAHPFGSRKKLEVGKDLQPLIYEICLSAAGDRDIAEAGLVYPAGGPGGIGRVLSGKDLERGRDWCLRCIAVARQLLGTGAFAPLPDDIACAYCSHECADGDLARIHRKVEELAGSTQPRTDTEEALVALWKLRHEEDDGDE